MMDWNIDRNLSTSNVDSLMNYVLHKLDNSSTLDHKMFLKKHQWRMTLIVYIDDMIITSEPLERNETSKRSNCPKNLK